MDNIKNHFLEEDSCNSLYEQLWSLYFDQNKYHCVGIIELNHALVNAMEKKDADIDFDNIPPLAFMKMEKIPQEEEASLNFLSDISIVSICPNIYLFLEAVHEGKSDEIKQFHLNVYERIQKFISTDKHFDSLDRVNKPFQWKATEKGFLINQHGQKILKFSDPLLAYWVSIVGSQFSHVFQFIFQQTLNKIGASSMMSFGADGSITMTNMELEAIKNTKESYEHAKTLLKELKWDIYQNRYNMKIFLE